MEPANAAETRATRPRFLHVTTEAARRRRALEASAPDGVRRLGDTEIVAVDLDAPIADMALAPGVARALLDLRRGSERVATTLVPVLDGVLAAAQVVEAERDLSGGSPQAAPVAGAEPLPVLMYHRIARVPASAPLARYATDPSAFEEQLAWLRAEGYRSSGLDDAEGRRVLLTFDDGYADFAEHAVPLLHRYGFGAELFVVSGRVGGVSEWELAAEDRSPLLSWEALAALPPAMVTIGAHTVTHPHLLTVPLGAAADELAASKAEIEDRLGRSVDALAYPYGGCDEAIARLARGLGYDRAYTTKPGHAVDPRARHLVPRLEVRGGVLLSAFAALVRGSRSSPGWWPSPARPPRTGTGTGTG